MDVLLLSRLQFAATALFHFLFVPLTLGLSVLLVITEWKYVRSGDETHKNMAKFWGKLFVINFAIGVLTGIPLEFQFGTNWSRYSAYVGDIFGSLLAIEATVAFFLESTFLAVWIFGWERLSKKAHAWSITLVAIASNLSRIFWIILLIVLTLFMIFSATSTHLYSNYTAYPVLLFIPFAAMVSLLTTGRFLRRGLWDKAWYASGTSIFSTVLFGVVGMYPALLPSSLDPAYSRTVFNSSSSSLTLKIMLGVVLIFVPLIIIYQVWVYRLFRGKVREEYTGY